MSGRHWIHALLAAGLVAAAAQAAPLQADDDVAASEDEAPRVLVLRLADGSTVRIPSKGGGQRVHNNGPQTSAAHRAKTPYRSPTSSDHVLIATIRG